jgi:hypothetical protein
MPGEGAPMSDEAWSCPTCRVDVRTAYCPDCGERPFRAHEYTLRGVLGEGWQAVTNLDDRVLRTVRRLLGGPGQLTLSYLNGPRKPYIGPFALFLLANVVFVGMEPLAQSHIFSATLDNQLHRQPWSPFATQLVGARLSHAGLSLQSYAPVFDSAVASHARSLVVLMVLPFAMLLPLVLFRRRPSFVANVVFSLHFHAFVLLLFSAALLVPALSLAVGGTGMASQRLDDVLSVTMLLIVALYLYRALGTVYASTGVARVAQAGLLAAAAATIVLGYRFFLFLITIYGTT